CEKIFFCDRRPSRDSLISIRQFPPLVNRFFDFFAEFLFRQSEATKRPVHKAPVFLLSQL
ncbi:MAG: hypothetical protein KH319_06180, partial [Butyricicoccus pullicaecorum]|nr:hypothetical protein [Butyricicoccus pullicaecorum]